MITSKRGSERALEQNYSVPALDKGLDILEYLAAARAPRTQAEIARALGRTPSEIFRMLTCLEQRHYISRDPVSGAFTLTLRLFELSHTHSPFQSLIAAATRPMRSLVIRTGESCHLGTMHHGQLLILGQEETTAAVRVSVEVGSTQSLIHTVSGRLLLSMLSVDERDAILASDTDWKKLKPRQQRDLKGHLELIRDRGYEDAKSAFIEGVFDLSVPIRASNSALHAALTITVLSWRNRPSGEDATKQLLPALIESAAEIQRVAGLGFRLP